MLFLGIGQAFAFDQPSVAARIIGVRYFDRPSYSRLVIELNDTFQYSVVRQGDEIRILFAKAQVPALYDGARFQYSSGLLDRVWIDRLKNDSVVVTVLARKNTAFNLRKAQQLVGLLLDVHPDFPDSLAHDTASVQAESTVALPLVIQPIQTISQNSLLPAGTQQLQVSVPAESRMSIAMTSILEKIADLRKVNPLHASLAIALAVAGTGLLLLLLRRLHIRGPKQGRSAFPTEFADAGSKQENLPHIGRAAAEGARETIHQVAERSEQEASVLGLAKKYGRGLGEINLSMNLKARQRENQWAKRAQRLAEVTGNSRDKAELAKELGIGRGEVDLAMLFHHLKAPSTLREELI